MNLDFQHMKLVLGQGSEYAGGYQDAHRNSHHECHATVPTYGTRLDDHRCSGMGYCSRQLAAPPHLLSKGFMFPEHVVQLFRHGGTAPV